MKKLLSILGAITLCGTTSVSVVACGNGATQKNDLSGLPTKVAVTTIADVDAYKTALVTVLNKQTKFNALIIADVDITKEDGSALGTKLKNSDIKTGNLSTKVTAQNSSTKFTGSTVITVNLITATEVIDLKEDVESLAFNNNELYAGASDGWIYKINLSSKIKEDIINLGADVKSLTFNDQNELYAGTRNGWIYKINLSPSLTTKTEVVDLRATVQSLAFNNNYLYAGENYGSIYKIDPSSKTKEKVMNLLSSVESLAFNNNYLYAGASDGSIYKINPSSSTKTEVIDLRAGVESLAFNNNYLYAGSRDGWIYKIDPSSKTKEDIIYLWVDVESLTSNNNELYAVTNDKIIYKIKI